MHILQIIIKNTSTLDFTLPVLWKLSNMDNSIKISILYCVFDKKQILRKSQFYSGILDDVGITQYDLASFINPKFRFSIPFLRKLFSFASADKVSIKDTYVKHQNKGLVSRIGITISELVHNYGIKGMMLNFVLNIAHYIQKKWLLKLIDFNSILPILNADYILYDSRDTSNYIGRSSFYAFFEKTQTPIGLVPHAPHLRDPVSEFAPFDEKGNALPDYCQFWVPLKYGTPWLAIPDKKKNFFITGYPGMDSQWLNFLKSRNNSYVKNNKKLKVLFVIRRYLPKGESRTEQTDDFIINYEDFIEPLKALNNCLLALCSYELIIKPHPSNNYQELLKDIQSLHIKNYSISYEPIYQHIGEVDMVISLPSTVLLISAMAGIPTIIINNELQQKIHKRWSILEDMYSKMSYFLPNLESMKYVLDEIINVDHKNRYNSSDIQHLRNFYDDNATDKVIHCIDVKS